MKCLKVEENLDCGCGHISSFPLGRTGGNKAAATSGKRLCFALFVVLCAARSSSSHRSRKRNICQGKGFHRGVYNNYWRKDVIRGEATQHSTSQSCTPRVQGREHCLFLCLYFCSWLHGFGYHLNKIRRGIIQSAIPQTLILVP